LVKFFKTTVIGGIVFLVPVIVFIAVVGKAMKWAKKFAAPISTLIPIDSFGDIAVVNIVALIIVILICFLAGLAARTAFARKIVDSLESKILSKLPVYELMKSKMSAIVQAEKADSMKPVLARFDDSWQIALEVERINGGIVTVYVPGAPDPWSGSVCYMTEDRIQPIDVKLPPVLRTLKVLGKGSNDHLRTYLGT
jgi:uncharacterized membrane protein